MRMHGLRYYIARLWLGALLNYPANAATVELWSCHTPMRATALASRPAPPVLFTVSATRSLNGGPKRRQPASGLAVWAGADGAVQPTSQDNEPQRASSKSGFRAVNKAPGQVSGLSSHHKAQAAVLGCTVCLTVHDATQANLAHLDAASTSSPPCLQRGMLQQTLRRSFTVGGIGLHTGEFAVVRVAPALADEGRYFVRVPPGAISPLWETERPTATQLDGARRVAGWASNTLE